MRIEIEITDTNVIILSNDLLDIQKWVQDVVTGKIANCKKRMLNEWMPRLLADPVINSLPATEDGIISIIIAHPLYKGRAKRDAEEMPSILKPKI